jgi:signal transduction histidine kinase
MAGPSDDDARLRARDAELAAWAQRAGHDLRSPLAVISGMAETLEAAWDRLSPEDRARMLASIKNQAARALAMVDEAVTLARGDDGVNDEGRNHF